MILQQIEAIGLPWYIVSQIFTIVGVAALVIVPHLGSMQKMRAANILGAIVNIIAFGILGAWAGVFALAVYGSQTLTIFLMNLWGKKDIEETRLAKAIKVVFLAIALIVGISGFSAPRDILAVAANFIGMAAMLLVGPKAEKTARWALLAVGILWLAYNALIGSIFGIIGNLIIVGSCAGAVYKHNIKSGAE